MIRRFDYVDEEKLYEEMLNQYFHSNECHLDRQNTVHHLNFDNKNLLPPKKQARPT